LGGGGRSIGGVTHDGMTQQWYFETPSLSGVQSEDSSYHIVSYRTAGL
jgi:O-acetylhomoserine/O-acetylserine sulfhydrylase-like pyridoxal-dependent enzyme